MTPARKDFKGGDSYSDQDKMMEVKTSDGGTK